MPDDDRQWDHTPSTSHDSRPARARPAGDVASVNGMANVRLDSSRHHALPLQHLIVLQVGPVIPQVQPGPSPPSADPRRRSSHRPTLRLIDSAAMGRTSRKISGSPEKPARRSRRLDDRLRGPGGRCDAARSSRRGSLQDLPHQLVTTKPRKDQCEGTVTSCCGGIESQRIDTSSCGRWPDRRPPAG